MGPGLGWGELCVFSSFPPFLYRFNSSQLDEPNDWKCRGKEGRR